MPQMLLPIFPAEATSINPLLGFCRKDDMGARVGYLVVKFCQERAKSEITNYKIQITNKFQSPCLKKRQGPNVRNYKQPYRVSPLYALRRRRQQPGPEATSFVCNL
jgi:hypothetical protein